MLKLSYNEIKIGYNMLMNLLVSLHLLNKLLA